MTTLRDVTGKTHSYRSHNPTEIIEIATNDDLGPIERLEQAETALKFIESKRLFPFLEDLYSMFIRLDRDEKDLFTRRNPDLVQWMSAWGHSQEATDPLEEWFGRGNDELATDLSGARDPPPFQRREIQDETLLQDMMFRRRSYREWTPQEFIEIGNEPSFMLSRGELRELNLFSPEVRKEIDTPTEVEGKLAARGLFTRIEADRFEPAIELGHKFFIPLDVDERRMFAARNPGIVMWISAWGLAENQIHGENLLVEMPTLREERA